MTTDPSPADSTYTRSDAESYSQLSITGTTYELGFSALASMLGVVPPDQTFLDFGAGTGRSTEFLISHGIRNVCAVDNNAAMVEGARQRGIDVMLIDGSIPLPTNAVDGVLTAFVLSEITTLEALREVLNELSRVLRPGGSLFVITMSALAAGATFRDFGYDESGGDARGVTCTIYTSRGNVTVVDTCWRAEELRAELRPLGFGTFHAAYPTGSRRDFDATDEALIPPFLVMEAVLGCGG